MRNRPSIARFILDNLGWMLASLVLAVIIWYTAVSTQNPVEQRRFQEALPIEWQIDPGLLIANKPPSTVQVTIRALQSVWNDLEAKDIKIVADLSNRGPGTYTIDPEGTLIDIRGGSVVKIQPDPITVELARREEKRVNVIVQFTQDAPVGYTATATPEVTNVLVVGPEAAIAQVESVQARVSLQNQRASFSRTVTLSPVDANNKVISDVTLSPSEVLLNVEIQQRPDVTELSVDPRLIGELPAGYLRRNYNWSPTRIIVRGDQAAIAAMAGVAPTEPIDLTGRTQTFTQTVKLALPSGVIMPDPTDITVTIEIEPVLVSHEFTDIPVQTQGLDPADFLITVKPERVSVIVRGPQTAIDGLTASDISVFAPLSGLSAGTHTVTLQPSVTKADIAGENVTIPNNQAEVTIIARNPTMTPTQGPTRTPTLTPTPGATLTETPAQ